MSQTIIEQWLQDLSNSIMSFDLEAHMALVSSEVQVYGLPSGKVVNYQQWKIRRQNEFNNEELQGLSYTLLKVKNMTLRRLVFNVEENMQARDGPSFMVNKDIILELEEDNCWRVVEEKIHHWKAS
ncbi:MAG: hypothetical protein OQK73_04130 [Gammaproteobacteria bacterium]|nr:hypothetical protein [Gammaproteobacteria bacterium]